MKLLLRKKNINTILISKRKTNVYKYEVEDNINNYIINLNDFNRLPEYMFNDIKKFDSQVIKINYLY